jgi:hypothetical protein
VGIKVRGVSAHGIGDPGLVVILNMQMDEAAKQRSFYTLKEKGETCVGADLLDIEFDLGIYAAFASRE